MKKCASCTKDLPDAALHCVFCGAKQPPAPATPPAAAKTVMGYSGPELDQLRAQAAAKDAQRPHSPSSPPPAAAPSGPRPPSHSPLAIGPTQATAPASGPLGMAPTQMTTPASGPLGTAPTQMTTPAGAPPLGMAPTQMTTPASGPMPPSSLPSPGGAPPYGGSNPALAPVAGASAPTMFEQHSPFAAPKPAPSGPVAAAGAFNVPPPGMQTLAQAEANRLPMPGSPPGPAPSPAPAPAAAPAASPPYLASQTAGRAARPVDPWRGALRKWLLVFGGLLIIAFVLPLSTDPMVFNWDVIIDGEGAQKLPPLIMVAVGFLSIVMGLMPLGTSPRGAIALLLGLTGIFVPTLIAGMPPWQTLVATVGLVLVPMGLIARHEYRDAKLPRILVTVGALMYLTLWLVPQGDTIPIVGLFAFLAEAPGALKILAILLTLQVLLVVLSLLCWLPAPASGGALPIAWMLLLYPLVMFAAMLFLIGDPSVLEHSPAVALAWTWGAGAAAGGEAAAMLGGLSIGVSYLVLTSYGGAAVMGKSLE